MKNMVIRSFLRGFVRSIDVSGTKEWPNISNSMVDDYLAIRRDWENVGNTIERACEQYTKSRN